MPEVVEQLRATARHLVGADGVAVVELRDGRCHYVVEDAQSPLSAGQTFAAETCISGMAMAAGQTIVIPDVRADPRIPQAAYAPTFVRSMAIAPIGTDAALGAYWATLDAPDDRRVQMLEALARVAASAVEDIRHVAAAAHSEIQLRGVLDSVSDCYYAVDDDWNVVEFSRSAEAYFRLKREDVLGKNLWDLFPQGRDSAYEDLCNAAMNDRAQGRLEAPSDFRPGRTVELRAAPMVGGISMALTDITERRRAEADLLVQTEELKALTRDLQTRIAAAVAEREAALGQLHEAQKTEALGQIAGGVAHDFNNLLSPILGGLELLRRRGMSDERAGRLIDGALQSAERARILVQRMLSFARRQPLQPRPVDVAALVDNLHSLLSSSVGSRVRIVIEAEADLPPALADANQLELALLNLVVNARDAMPDGGMLTITASSHVPLPKDARQGAFVKIAVIDTGTGMNEATLKRAVEPFFSTKGIGKGTGLGLSMVHGLAAQLGGALELSSTLGVGTTVALLLPVAERPSQADRAETPLALAPTLGAVLLVDDEAIVRESTREMLEDLGYSVVEAASAQEAITILDAGGAFDWIITDHMMPGMTGADLARAVLQRRPELKVLIVSGFADVDDIDAGPPAPCQAIPADGAGPPAGGGGGRLTGRSPCLGLPAAPRYLQPCARFSPSFCCPCHSSPAAPANPRRPRPTAFPPPAIFPPP